MDLKGSKTEKNLMTAFAGESQARNKYNFYAKIAKEEGYEQIGELKNEIYKKIITTYYVFSYRSFFFKKFLF